MWTNPNVARAQSMIIKEIARRLAGRSRHESLRLENAMRSFEKTIGEERLEKEKFIARIEALEGQVKLLEDHHTRGLWHALDRISMLELRDSSLKCIVCEHEDLYVSFETRSSECLFGGGRLERYICPVCDCIFGARKFLSIDAKMVDLDYRLLYSRYREGPGSAVSEMRAFEALNALQVEGTFVNWGAGAWNDTTEKLQEKGYDCWSYEPSAPISDPRVITQKEAIPVDLAGIFSNNVIEHFLDPVEQFQEFQRMLAPGAKMAHASPCYKYLYPFTRFHTVFLLGKSPEVLAERTGFRIVSRIDEGEFICIVFEKM